MSSALTPSGSTRRWRRLRMLVLERDRHRCQLFVDVTGRHVEDDDPAATRRCGAYAEHVDHIRRRADGGDDRPSNLRAACVVGNLTRSVPSQDRSPRPNGPPGHRMWTWH